MTDTDSWDLDELAGAHRLADWMFEQFSANVHGRVIEIGAGIGTFSERILESGVDDLLLVEPDDACAEVLRERFGSNEKVTVTTESVPGSSEVEARAGTTDFVLCQNVLEHIEDHEAAVVAMTEALRPGGRLTILVPAHPRLYGSLDRTYGHFRRYTRELLRGLADRAGLEVLDLYSFNALGIPGWWVKSRRGSTSLGSRSLAAYEMLVRFWRPIESRRRLPWGLSLILHARKPG